VSTLILAVDTTSDPGSIALTSEVGILEEIQLVSPDGLAHVLFGEIDALLARAKVDVRDIAAFASASGPGSFTGVRIGLTAVKGLAEATGRPVVAVSNLRALASFGSGPVRAVAIDARRGEIYGAAYNDALETVHEEVVMKLDSWLASLPQGAMEGEMEDELEFVIPAGGTLLASAFPRGRLIEAPRALAGAIGKIALGRFRSGLAQDPAEIDANYVRRSDAELLWKDPAAAKGPTVR